MEIVYCVHMFVHQWHKIPLTNHSLFVQKLIPPIKLQNFITVSKLVNNIKVSVRVRNVIKIISINKAIKGNVACCFKDISTHNFFINTFERHNHKSINIEMELF